MASAIHRNSVSMAVVLTPYRNEIIQCCGITRRTVYGTTRCVHRYIELSRPDVDYLRQRQHSEANGWPYHTAESSFRRLSVNVEPPFHVHLHRWNVRPKPESILRLIQQAIQTKMDNIVRIEGRTVQKKRSVLITIILKCCHPPGTTKIKTMRIAGQLQ